MKSRRQPLARIRPRVRNRLRRWRGHTCLDCGFLSFDEDQEVPESDRRLIAAKGTAGWWTETPPFDCAKHMWDWEIGGSRFDVVTSEANYTRYGCTGFRAHVH